MRHNITSIFIGAALLAAAVSCSEILETSPSDKISSGNMWTTPDLAQKGMNGLYETFYNRNQSKGTQVRSENLDGLNKYGIEALGFCTDYYANNYPIYLLYNSAKQAHDWQVNHDWEFCYTIVHASNDAIANLQKAGLDEATYHEYICEAKFLRAWAYARLSAFWQSVPIYLEPVSNEQCTKGQSPADSVYTVIVNDLKDCINDEYFAENNIDGSRLGRPSKGAAYALLGKTYMWMEKWPEAIENLSAVKGTGYRLWPGKYIDFFTAENEHDPEMIFAIQYDSEAGYADNIQQALGARDTYDSWDEVKPSADFVDYYQNADGTTFEWSQVPGLEDWNSLTPQERAVFFCRDGLNSNSLLKNCKTNAIKVCGEDAFNKYYLDSGNEARIKKAYDNRDPRLKETILTPYEPVDCYKANYNNDENQIGKQLRWPLYQQGTNGGDFWLDKRTSAFYCYRKYVRFLKDELIQRDRCYTDFPLLRYTDVQLSLAESYIMNGQAGLATPLINEVRANAGMPPVAEADMEILRYERRVAFPVEAINFFDEVRWGTYKQSKFQGKDVHGGQSWWGDDTVEYAWYWDDCLWPWPVPRNETQRNTNLTPTPGWVY